MLPFMKYLLILCLTSNVAVGETWHVPKECESIQAAIDAASDGDEILVAPGVWKETIHLLGKTIYLHSEQGAEATVIHGGKKGTVLTCTANANSTIEGFTIRGGEAELGGGIFVFNASPIVRLCMIDFNTAKEGGGVYIRNGTPSLTNVFFHLTMLKMVTEFGRSMHALN